MTREQIEERFHDIERLTQTMNKVVPIKPQNSDFRAELARLLIINIVSAYENSVKTTMIEFAEKKHRDFGHYVRTHKEYINARIQKCHLIDYANDFSEEIKDRFKVKLEQLEKKHAQSDHQSMSALYDELIKQRHRSAHLVLSDHRTFTATIEETERRHQICKNIVLAFHDAFQ